MNKVSKKEIIAVGCEVASVLVGGVVVRIALTLIKNYLRNSEKTINKN